MKKVIQMFEGNENVITAKANLDGASWSLVPAHTGREVKETDTYYRVTEWAKLQTVDELENNLLALEFMAFLEHVELVQGELELFRGRGVPRVLCPPESTSMGPPPQVKYGGRYHIAGSPALYLSDSENGTRREITHWLNRESTDVPFVQRFRLPAYELRIADLSNRATDCLITAVLSKAEECYVSRRGPESYLFSQTVAKLVARSFDGMLIRGVRGEKGAHYNNIVIFTNHVSWRNWLVPGSPPYELAI